MQLRRMSAVALAAVCLFAVPLHADAPLLDAGKADYLNQLRQSKGEEYAAYYKSCLEAYAALEGPVDVVMLGDSLTYRGDWSDLSGELRIENLGINQDTIPGLQVRLDQAADLRPHTLFLLIGINDLGARMRPEVYRDYAALLDKLIEAMPDTKIYVESILPVRDDMRAIMDNSVIREVNVQLRQLAYERGLPYIDVFPSLLDPADGRLYQEYQLDGLHLTDEGYQMWKTVLRPYIQIHKQKPKL